MDRIFKSEEEKLLFHCGIIYMNYNLFTYKDCAYTKYYFVYKNDDKYLNISNCNEI